MSKATVACHSRRAGILNGTTSPEQICENMPAAPPDEEPRAAPLPVDELVRDLESGTTLEELRRELHESPTRMMEADDALKHAAAQYFQNGSLT